jgi:hypothetical protein
MSAGRTAPRHDTRGVERTLGARRLERALAATFFGVTGVILGVLAILWIELLIWILSWIASLLAAADEASYTTVACLPEVELRQGESPLHVRRSMCSVPAMVPCDGGQI